MEKIQILVMDVDGTLTDGKIYISAEGECFKAFNVKDGYAIANILPKYGIEPMIITGRNSDIVLQRCRELGIKEIYQGVERKAEFLKSLLEKRNLNFSQVAYFGDDLPDRDCLMLAGISGCPSDAVEEIKGVVSFISSKKGGEGAVRDFIERIIKESTKNKKDI